MSQINTISEFLLHAGTNYRIFDMGRAIRPIESQLFLDIELGSIPAPYPRQQHAWFGIIFFNPSLNQEHYIWFVKFPLDEQGLVMNAARQQFLQIVVDALGQQLDKNSNNHLPENPFTFIPPQQLRADFNSISRRAVGLPPSQYHALAAQYVQSPQMVEWQNLSVQGIADVLTLIQQNDIENAFIQQFKNFAPEVQFAFCHSFENHPISPACTTMLLDWWRAEPNTPERLIAVLRALSQSDEHSLLSELIKQVLAHNDWLNQDIMIILAARHWQSLQDIQLLSVFMHKLAETNAGLFGGLFRDLVQIPDNRAKMLSILRIPDKSSNLALAIEQLFASETI